MRLHSGGTSVTGRQSFSWQSYQFQQSYLSPHGISMYYVCMYSCKDLWGKLILQKALSEIKVPVPGVPAYKELELPAFFFFTFK